MYKWVLCINAFSQAIVLEDQLNSTPFCPGTPFLGEKVKKLLRTSENQNIYTLSSNYCQQCHAALPSMQKLTDQHSYQNQDQEKVLQSQPGTLSLQRQFGYRSQCK